MTKKELINLLQSIYDKIPRCTCDPFTGANQVDFSCARHQMYTEAEINYIRMSLSNIAIKEAAKERA